MTRTFTTEIFKVDEVPSPVPVNGGGRGFLSIIRPLDPGKWCIRQYATLESAKSGFKSASQAMDKAQLAGEFSIGELKDGRFGLFIEKP